MPGPPPPAAPVDEALVARVRRQRLERLRGEMRARDIGSVVLVDPVNVRFATDTRNMQIFTARNPARYAFIAADGPVVLFEFAGCAHLAEGKDTVDEVRIARTGSYVAAAEGLDTVIAQWSAEIVDLARAHGGGSRRIGLERFSAAAAFAVRDAGFEVVDAQIPVERARAAKSSDELALVRASLAAAEAGVAAVRERLVPGASEQQVWNALWTEVIERGGDYVETRLLNSGARTNPWFQECSDKTIARGEMVALDTDVVGPHGYYADFSRSFVCGGGATPAQRELYRVAYDQLQHNLDLMRPGISFSEISARGWVIPPPYLANRYYLLAHGVGMTGEYPYIHYRDDRPESGYDGHLEPGMTLCVESFIGREDGGEGVKLEEQVVITESGYELMSHFPFEEDLLGREL